MKGKSLVRRLLADLGIVALCALAGYLLLVLAYELSDPQRQYEYCRTSAYETLDEAAYETETYSRRVLDNYTDRLMMLESVYSDGENPFTRAWQNRRWVVENNALGNGFLRIFAEGEQPVGAPSYERYWHGYQLTLRPLLHVMSYGRIRLLNSALQFFLLALVLLLMYRRAPRCLLPFGVMILLLAPTAIGKSLQFSSVYYIMLIELLLLLWNPRGFLSGDRLPLFFLLAGIATAFLDFLTAPTLTLTVPLCLLCADRQGQSAKEAAKRLLRCCLLWGIGYACMWGSKWLLDLIVTRGAFLTDLSRTMGQRAGTRVGGQDYSRLHAVVSLFKTLFDDRYLLLLALAYAAAVPVICRRELRARLPQLPGDCAFLALPVLCAVGWVLVLSNHSLQHAFFTYRTLAPCVFALLTAITPPGAFPQNTKAE